MVLFCLEKHRKYPSLWLETFHIARYANVLHGDFHFKGFSLSCWPNDNVYYYTLCVNKIKRWTAQMSPCGFLDSKQHAKGPIVILFVYT